MDSPTQKPKRSLAQEGASSGDSPGGATPLSLSHPISPPLKKRRISKQPPAAAVAAAEEDEDIPETNLNLAQTNTQETEAKTQQNHKPNLPKQKPTNPSQHQILPSPFHLTTIQDLPPNLNTDTLTLRDLLGDPLISECWEFNYLHDIDFLLSAFDSDVRHLVQVHVVHGFWKNEDPNRLELERQAARHKNVVLHAAYLPEMFGTHHTKMMVLMRHDGTAQVVIHTANMIVRDWRNMTQAVWRSPVLRPLEGKEAEGKGEIGSGARFKVDFLNYLRAYDAGRRFKTLGDLVGRLEGYDFSPVRGALVGSVPGRHHADAPAQWGWAALREVIAGIPVRGTGAKGKSKSEIVVQVSSIATLGPTDKWLKETLFSALRGGGKGDAVDFKVVFPTPDEIRRSLDGYASGGSIHTKTQSAQQKKQLEYLRPVFCHWGNDCAEGKELDGDVPVKEAGRKRAAPHIKTYIRYGNKSEKTIDWALLTSANLSKQAWGEARSSTGEVRIASYELGVLVWPELYAKDAVMSASFLQDAVPEEDVKESSGGPSIVSLRMPYNLPLQPYGSKEVPWVATADHTEPDWKGQIWRHR
ncbi:tyrosyl-DNA phosphodiesterase-domain-containing protein [Cercophora newfieldiana]|uniref:Tyrosyl-DNA phosphodiesterase-domain-containing protein n=1 Tax=Cercophora newfieldiana TaxID=92897 RepID=A0AA40CQ94_9PEZI|nr:tyrosyl-DNA phosphodiesterase-domain-containing protein [Cercophora newfieldiana]